MADRVRREFADPPEHTAHRKLIAGAMSAPAIASWEPRIRQTAQRFVDRLAARPQVEFVTEFAAPYTMTVIADILGLAADMVPRMLYWTRGFNSMIGNPLTDEEVAELNDTAAEPLSRDELLMVLQLAMVGGSDTSSTGLSRMMEYLCDEPGEWDRLRAEPELVPAFIEELLRTESPLQGLFRVATRDVELGGRKIAKGETLWLSLAAANRDPEVFENADEKRLSRHNVVSRYLMFGGGPHLCPGAALTRLELRVVLEMLVAKLSAVERVSPPADRIKSFMFYGPGSLPVSFTA
ncbi:cytochrome P450 [Nocardia nova SH22a]|uniref:Cytochrome P450 n=1 Tax=Nocardia nova SH22a TaxID=1415166 RepID=W5TJP5_9NOCA|nr:cytochrome P450 [Nocardia nova]AHH17471.1 cytochrome P450 [Nocardia nova SH22a]